MKKFLLLFIITAIFGKMNVVIAQNIAINSTGNLPDTSAMLDVSSTIKGFLTPRMTTAQRSAIPLPAKGLMIYNTTDNTFKVNTGTSGTPSWSTVLFTNNTTNTLSSSVNTLTNTTNGIVATAPIINTVSNTSSVNTLSTTINGVAGTTVPIINSNALSLSGSNLTSTINGIASSALNLSPAINATAWSLSGNTATNAATNYIGTTDAADFVARTNALERLRISSTGNVGIGASAPGQLLETMNGNVFINNNNNNSGELRIAAPSSSGAFYTSFKAVSQSANVSYTLPSAQASNANQILRNNGSGQLSWSNIWDVMPGTVNASNGDESIFSTSSNTDVLIPQMTIPVSVGKYIVQFNAAAYNSNSSMITTFSYFLNGVQIGESIRQFQNAGLLPVALMSFVNVLAAGNLDVRCKVSSSNSCTIYGRTLMTIRTE